MMRTKGTSARHILLAGRNIAPLTDVQIKRASNTFLGMDNEVNARHEPGHPTVFHVVTEEGGEQYGEIIFGPDILPGPGVADPNAALSLDAAVAHELCHFYRWRDALALDPPELELLDEALTSLQAIQRYEQKLKDHDIRQLVGDAIQRIMLYIHNLPQPHH
jgi:hypothetical protein